MIYKCLNCGKFLHWDVKEGTLICDCGSTEYKEINNMSDITCDNCGSRLKAKSLIQICENCGSSVINLSVAKEIDGISLAKISLDEVSQIVDEYISNFKFSAIPKNISIKLKYIPYWLVDGTCRIKSEERDIEIKHENTLVYADIVKDTAIKDNVVYSSDMGSVEKFNTKYISGHETSTFDTREQVITRLILDKIKTDAEIKMSTDGIDKDTANIEFEPDGKMMALMPLYEVDIGSHKLYVNGQNGEIYGHVPKSFRKVVEYKVLKYMALASVIFTIIFMGGLFQL